MSNDGVESHSLQQVVHSIAERNSKSFDQSGRKSQLHQQPSFVHLLLQIVSVLQLVEREREMKNGKENEVVEGWKEANPRLRMLRIEQLVDVQRQKTCLLQWHID